MGCDIHLFVETKRKDSKYDDWECSAFKGAFSERNYGMFGALNNVRNYCEYKPLPSSRIAAYKLGFDFVGCEIDKEYFDKSVERFNRECLGEYKEKNGKITKQLELFQ